MIDINLQPWRDDYRTEQKKLDFENIGQWPSTIRWAIIAFVCAIVFFIGYTIDSVAQFERLDNSISQEQNLKQQAGGSDCKIIDGRKN